MYCSLQEAWPSINNRTNIEYFNNTFNKEHYYNLNNNCEKILYHIDKCQECKNKIISIFGNNNNNNNEQNYTISSLITNKNNDIIIIFLIGLVIILLLNLFIK